MFATRSPNHSSSSPRKTRSKWRAPTRCPKPSSTASSSTSSSTTSPRPDEVAVVQQTTSRSAPALEPVFTGEDILAFQNLVRHVPIAEDVVRFAVRLSAASRPGTENSPAFVNNWVNWGAGTRAAQALVIGAKARALWQGRTHATIDDIRALAAPVLRHRILLNYRAEADGVDVEHVIEKLLSTER